MVIEIIISEIDFEVIERIRKLRVKADPYIDQVELAQRIGVSEGYIGQIENLKHKAKYNLRLIGRVAKALGLDTYEPIMPEKTLNNDLVRIKLKLSKIASKKHEVDESGNVLNRYEVLSKKPLNDDDLEKWNLNKLDYLTIIKE